MEVNSGGAVLLVLGVGQYFGGWQQDFFFLHFFIKFQQCLPYLSWSGNAWRPCHDGGGFSSPTAFLHSLMLINSSEILLLSPFDAKGHDLRVGEELVPCECLEDQDLFPVQSVNHYQVGVRGQKVGSNGSVGSSSCNWGYCRSGRSSPADHFVVLFQLLAVEPVFLLLCQTVFLGVLHHLGGRFELGEFPVANLQVPLVFVQ